MKVFVFDLGVGDTFFWTQNCIVYAVMIVGITITPGRKYEYEITWLETKSRQALRICRFKGCERFIQSAVLFLRGDPERNPTG